MSKIAPTLRASYGCSIDVEPSSGERGVWLYSRTATEVNRALHLTPAAAEQLRDSLAKSLGRERSFWGEVLHRVRQARMT
jgi:hypothetical protein